jgi:hypothetical protein
MVGHEDARSLTMDLSDGAKLDLQVTRVEISEAQKRVARERYGNIHKLVSDRRGAKLPEIAGESL